MATNRHDEPQRWPFLDVTVTYQEVYRSTDRWPAIVAAGLAIVDHVLELPAIGPLEPLLANVYFQLFPCYVANEKDRPIDKPRHLVKRVTVE